MNRRLFLAAAVLFIAPLASGCDDGSGPKKLTVDELSKMIDSKSPPAVIDANGERVRKEYGKIPGAKLIDGAKTYDVSATLPASKSSTLVFYCSSTWCSAAKTAGKRAQAAGYTDVNVLPAGIKGWKSAGKKTEEI